MTPYQPPSGSDPADAMTAPLDADVAREFTRALAALKPPPSQVGLRQVFHNAAACLDVVFKAVPQAAAAFSALREAISQCAHSTAPHGPSAMIMLEGMRAKFPAWTLMASLHAESGDEVRLLLGAELLLATRREGVMRSPVLDRVATLCRRTLKEERRSKLQEQANNYAKRLLGELDSLCDGELRNVEAHELNLQQKIIACFVSRTKPAHPTGQAPGQGMALTDLERRFHLSKLSARCDENDAAATILITAFRMGVPWYIAKEIPLDPFQDPSSLMWIDTAAGVVFVDLTRVFLQQARVRGPQFKPSSLVLRLRLPRNVKAKLHALYAACPAAQRLGDLAPQDAPPERALNSMSQGAIKLSLARLQHGAGAGAVRAGVDPVIAAYIALDLGLVGGSAHPYFNADPNELCDGEDRWFTHLGLAPAALGQDTAVSTGAAATPTSASIAGLFTTLVDRVTAARPGRNCGLERLLRFHDAFARLVAFVVILCLGCRREGQLGLRPGNVGLQSVLYQHKRVGPGQGLSLLPIPAVLQTELKLWLAHLKRLDRRLSRFEQSDSILRARFHIRAALAGQGQALIFVLTGGYRPIGSTDVFEGVPPELRLTPDFARHFIPNAARTHGINHSLAEAWMRHHNGAKSHYSSTSLICQSHWMSAMASAIDAICADLKVRPVVGLGE